MEVRQADDVRQLCPDRSQPAKAVAVGNRDLVIRKLLSPDYQEISLRPGREGGVLPGDSSFADN
jgi:hypothetical protein